VATKLRTFTVYAKVFVETNTTIRAKDLRDAAEQALGLTERDFVEFDGDFMDGSIKVTALYEEEDK